MFIFVYHFIWTLVFLPVIPFIPFIKKRKRLTERLALRLPSRSLREGNIWIHALSVGEVISAIPLVEAISLSYPCRDIVFTVTTSKGMTIAQDKLAGKVKAFIIMPVDFWWSVHRIVTYIRPSLFILVETDIWPAIIDHLKKKGVKSLLVNGRVSPRTFKYYRRFPHFTRMIFKELECCLMQSDLDRDRLLKAGISAEKVVTAGNIKFDRAWIPMNQKERRKWFGLLDIKREDLVWVAGSTHPGEEEILLKVFSRLLPSFRRLRLILAPRNIERSDEILRQAQKAGFRAQLRTVLPGGGEPYDVLILNSLGELGRIYGLARISFVGGSLVPFGGHNLLEPAGFGCPVLFGPYTDNFLHMSESLVEAGGGRRAQDGEELYEAVRRILKDSNTASEMGALAKVFVETNRGALERVMQSLKSFIA